MLICRYMYIYFSIQNSLYGKVYVCNYDFFTLFNIAHSVYLNYKSNAFSRQGKYNPI